MIRIFAIGLLSISILSGCSTNFFSLPDKFDICEVDIRELSLTDDFPNNIAYIRVGWCLPSVEKDKEND
jgi:hypothetical protein